MLRAWQRAEERCAQVLNSIRTVGCGRETPCGMLPTCVRTLVRLLMRGSLWLCVFLLACAPRAFASVCAA